MVAHKHDLHTDKIAARREDVIFMYEMEESEERICSRSGMSLQSVRKIIRDHCESVPTR